MNKIETEDTFKTKIGGNIKDKQNKYKQYLSKKIVNEEDLNIICVFNDEPFFYEEKLDKVMGSILYNKHHELFFKTKDKEKKNPIKPLFLEDEYKIIHGIWFFNSRINKLFYNYRILE